MSADREREELRAFYQARTSEELLEILRDRDGFRPQAVEVARELLAERGVAVDEVAASAAEIPSPPAAPARAGGDDLVRRISRCPVTAATVAAAAAVSVAFWTGADIGPLVMTREALSTQPWRLLTSALAHLDVVHLLYNAFWVWALGRFVEERLGAARTAALYALLAAGSAAAEFALFDGGIGLSGVGYGLFGMRWVLGRRAPDVYGALDRRVIHVFVGWFFFCIAASAARLWSVANVAHGAGALLGALVGMAMTARPGTAARWRAALVGSLASLWVLGALARPYVNLGDGVFHEYRERAFAAYEDGDSQAAVALYEEATRLRDRDPVARYELGVALAAWGRLEQALAAFGHAALLAPEHAESVYMQAWCLGELGQDDPALGLLERALELDPGHALAHARTGWTLARTGRFGEALDWLDQGRSLDPGSAVIHAWRGWVLMELDRYEEAVEATRRAVELEPEDGWFHALLGSALAGLGRFDEALTAGDRALELDPTSADAWVARSWVLGTAGRFEPGLEATERALELDPESESARLNRGWMLLELGRFREAIVECDAVLARNPLNAKARENRAAATRALE